MKKWVFLSFLVSLSAAVLMGTLVSSSALAADKVTLNLVSFVPKMNISYRGWAPLFEDKINKRAKGRLFIKYRGGPEVIPPFDLARAVSKGAIDMAILPSSFYNSVVPGADTMRLSMISTAEERARGVYALQRKIHKKAGIYFVGNLQPIHGFFFYVVLRKPVKTREDFKGLKLAGSPPFLPCFQALGAAAVKAALKEYYPSVERGVIDGNIVGLDVYLGIAEYEVAPYVIDHPFYKAPNVLIMNYKKWNSLSDPLKKLLEEVQIETEKAWPDIWDKEVAKMKKKAISGGAKFIKLDPDTAKWYFDTFYTAGWKWSEEHFPPDVIAQFKKLISKP